MAQLNAWFLLKRQGDKPHVIAHRGASGYAPENTLAAYQKALDLGIVAVETDVHQTQDGVIVTLHDETLERTTNGRGAVAERPWQMIRKLDAGSWYGSQYSSERVPSLDAYLSCLDGRAVPVIEIKGGVDVGSMDGLVRLSSVCDEKSREQHRRATYDTFPIFAASRHIMT